jgi:hypothetical protein
MAVSLDRSAAFLVSVPRPACRTDNVPEIKESAPFGTTDSVMMGQMRYFTASLFATKAKMET